MEFNYYRISTGTLAAIAVVLVCCAVVAVVLRRTTSATWSRSVWIAASLASAAAVLLITLAPGRHAATYSCEFSGSPFAWLDGNQSTANVILLVPLAVALPLAAQSTRWFRWSFVALIVFPVLIEATQATIPLGRACDGMDIVDNWFGVAFGCLIGWGFARLARRFGGQPDASSGPR